MLACTQEPGSALHTSIMTSNLISFLCFNNPKINGGNDREFSLSLINLPKFTMADVVKLVESNALNQSKY